jgi:hypothetical protein
MQGIQCRIPGLLAALVLAAGCTSRMSNLTPTASPRESSGLYHFETEWTSTQRTRNLRQSDIRAFVIVEEQVHPMERIPGMTNRWEADVPLPAGKNPVFYHFKWEYVTAGFGANIPNSIRSEVYRLEVVESLPPTR